MNMKKISTLCLAASTLFAASSAMAWESGDHSTSASVALSSDYVWRGYSQTDEDWAISGSFDYAHASGFYAGTWASNVDFGDDTSAELDIYAGFGGETDGGLGWDFGVLRYIYPGENYDWNEAYASLRYSFFSVGVAHSSDVYASGDTGTYYTLGFDYDLSAGIALSAGVGYYNYDDDVLDAGNVLDDSAVDYRIGLSTEMAGFGFDLTYYDTNSDGEDLYGKDLAEGRVVFTISASM
jgi:uncharacterized protein (TIGR02001 family)